MERSGVRVRTPMRTNENRFAIYLPRLILLVLALAATGCGDTAPKLAKLGASEVIVAFGDSLTYGTSAKEDESYPAVLAGPPEFYGELAKEFGIPYEGGILKDVFYSADMKSDAIHPNARGYRRMAEAIAELLRKSGAL